MADLRNEVSLVEGLLRFIVDVLVEDYVFAQFIDPLNC